MTVSLQSGSSQKKKRQTRSAFKRYQIDTSYAEPRYDLPHPFLPKVNKIGLAKILIGEVFEYNFKLLHSKYRKTLMSRPCIYGVFNSKVGGFSPIQERCTGCMRCVEEYPEVCTVDRNPAFTHFADSFWMPEDPNQVSDSPFATVWYEAKTGKIQVRGMGYKGFFASAGWDSMWTDMSEIVRPTRDGVYGREFISTQVDIGSRKNSLEFPIKRNRKLKSTSIPIPMIFDYFPNNLLSKAIAESLIGSARRIGTKYIFKPSQIEKFNLRTDKNLILYIDESNFGRMGSYITHASAVLVDETSLDLISRLRAIRSDIPILARLPYQEDTYETMKQLIDNSIDGFLLYADYHGNSFDQDGKFIKELIGETHRKLVDNGLRDKVTVISSGGIILAEHIPKAIIMGSDALAINTSALVALQIKFEGECRIPEKGKISSIDFDPKWGSQRLINLLGSWHNQLIEIMSAMGIKEVRRLRGDVGRAMFKEELEEVAFGDIERID